MSALCELNMDLAGLVDVHPFASASQPDSHTILLRRALLIFITHLTGLCHLFDNIMCCLYGNGSLATQ